MNVPAVSVVMPVFNGIPFLDESIQSVLNQTLEDFELLVLDNGSTDGSGTVLRDWARRDGRIRLFKRPRVLGSAISSNCITSKATAPLVARMDADDVSHPDRLRRQREVMRARADVALVGTLCDGIDSRGRRARPRDRWRLVGTSALAPFPHGSCMFRRALFDELGGYREACEPWEDQDLYWRMADRGRVVVLPDALYRYRYHVATATLRQLQENTQRATDLRDRCAAARRAGRDYTNLLERRSADVAHGEGAAGALRSIGALRLWAGQRPGILGALFRNWSIESRPAALRVLVLAIWGSVSPGSLRFVLRSLIRARDRAASTLIKGTTPREWRLG